MSNLICRYGGKRVFLVGIAATATLTLLTPILTKTGTGFLVTTRILEGLFEVCTRFNIERKHVLILQFDKLSKRYKISYPRKIT